MVTICGIAGFSLAERDLQHINPKTLTSRLALSIEHRGKDATGIAWKAGSDDRVRYVKQGITATQFVRNGENLANIPRDTQTMLVHTRMGTGGSPKENVNNHPIIVEPRGDHPGLVGIHNGMLWNHDELWAKHGALNAERKGEVDSELIFQIISRMGTEQLAQIEGDAALAWISCDAPNILNLARPGGRPLWVAFTETGSMVFASEKACIEDALAPYERNVKIDTLYDVMEGEHLLFKHGEFIDVQTVPVTKVARAKSYGGWSGSGWTSTGGSKSTSTTSKPKDDKPTTAVARRVGVAAYERELAEVVAGTWIDTTDDLAVTALMSFMVRHGNSNWKALEEAAWRGSSVFVEALEQHEPDSLAETLLEFIDQDDCETCGASFDPFTEEHPCSCKEDLEDALTDDSDIADGMPDWTPGVNYA